MPLLKKKKKTQTGVAGAGAWLEPGERLASLTVTKASLAVFSVAFLLPPCFAALSIVCLSTCSDKEEKKTIHSTGVQIYHKQW